MAKPATTAFDPRVHFRLNLPSDYACTKCNRVLHHPVCDAGEFYCKPCLAVGSKYYMFPKSDKVRLNAEMITCSHCLVDVPYSGARAHLEKDCGSVSRTLSESLELSTFDLVKTLCTDLNLGDESHIELKPLVGVMKPNEKGRSYMEHMNGRVYITTHGRVLFATLDPCSPMVTQIADALGERPLGESVQNILRDRGFIVGLVPVLMGGVIQALVRGVGG